MKNILCMLGLHKPSKVKFMSVERYHKGRDRHGSKYRRNYVICDRCNKALRPMSENRR